MSTVKRINATENGQLKAPDKWETTSKTIINTSNSASDTMSDTMSSSTIKNQSQQHSKDAQKSTNSVQQDSQVNIDGFWFYINSSNVRFISKIINNINITRINEVWAKEENDHGVG